MQDLLKEYKETRRQLKWAYEARRESEKVLDNQAITERQLLSEMIGDVEFVIEWLEIGRRPGNRRGIERQAAYQRERLMDPVRMQAFAARSTAGSPANLTEWQLHQIEDALCVLSERERECYVLAHGECFTHSHCGYARHYKKQRRHSHQARATKNIGTSDEQPLPCWMRLFFVVRMPPISERSFFFRENPFSYRLGNGAGFSMDLLHLLPQNGSEEGLELVKREIQPQQASIVFRFIESMKNEDTRLFWECLSRDSKSYLLGRMSAIDDQFENIELEELAIDVVYSEEIIKPLLLNYKQSFRNYLEDVGVGSFVIYENELNMTIKVLSNIKTKIYNIVEREIECQLVPLILETALDEEGNIRLAWKVNLNGYKKYANQRS